MPCCVQCVTMRVSLSVCIFLSVCVCFLPPSSLPPNRPDVLVCSLPWPQLFWTELPQPFWRNCDGRLTVRSQGLTVRSQAFTALRVGCACVEELGPPENRAYAWRYYACVAQENRAYAWGCYACCQGTRLWHHFPSPRAASCWVDLYFTLPQRMVLYSYSENGNAQQVPSFLVSFFSDFMSTLYRLSLSLSDYLLSFLVHARFHARFHACPFPPSLCLFPGKAFMSMLPAVPEKFKRRAVFLRVLMR